MGIGRGRRSVRPRPGCLRPGRGACIASSSHVCSLRGSSKLFLPSLSAVLARRIVLAVQNVSRNQTSRQIFRPDVDRADAYLRDRAQLAADVAASGCGFQKTHCSVSKQSCQFFALRATRVRRECEPRSRRAPRIGLRESIRFNIQAATQWPFDFGRDIAHGTKPYSVSFRHPNRFVSLTHGLE
jgi:hypothetical protein